MSRWSRQFMWLVIYCLCIAKCFLKGTSRRDTLCVSWAAWDSFQPHARITSSRREVESLISFFMLLNWSDATRRHAKRRRNSCHSSVEMKLDEWLGKSQRNEVSRLRIIVEIGMLHEEHSNSPWNNVSETSDNSEESLDSDWILLWSIWFQFYVETLNLGQFHNLNHNCLRKFKLTFRNINFCNQSKKLNSLIHFPPAITNVKSNA